MAIKTVSIIGGTGFIGRQLLNQLSKAGYRIRIITRSRNQHPALWVIPSLDIVEANIYEEQALVKALAGSDAVINLVGILNEVRDDGSGFRRAHVELVKKILAACCANRITRYLHMSALHADAKQGPSHYLKTKGEGEDLAHQTPAMQVTSFRPSVIFGPEDSFFNRFAALLRIAPYFFPLACAQSRFAPVYVNDVAAAMVHALEDPATHGQRYDLCGPRSYTLQALVEYTAQQTGLKRRIVPLSPEWSQKQAHWLEYVPGKPFSLDNYRSLQIGSICTGNNGFTVFGIIPTAVETVVPLYLANRNQRGRYQLFRSRAHHG